MTSLLKARLLWQFCQARIAGNEEQRAKNEEAKHLMYSAMDAAQIIATGACETAHDLWIKIRENHEGAEKDLQNNALADFLGFKFKPGESLIQYCGRYELALGRLLSTGHKVSEDTKLWVFRNSLPRDIRDVVNMWSLAKSDGKVSELITQLKVNFHLQKNERQPEDNVAFFSGETRDKKPQAKTTPQKDTCTYCKKIGHKWRDCLKLKADNKRKKNFATKRKAEEVFMAHEESDGNVSKDWDWIVDSGASRHMTPNKSWLHNYTEFENPIEIVLGDGDRSLAYGYGTVIFVNESNAGRLEPVWWVPKITRNLFSVQSTMARGYDVLFDQNNSVVKVTKDDEVRLIGYRVNSRLFSIRLEPTPTKEDNEVVYLGATMSDWHKRFAHANVSSIKKLVSNNAVENLQITNKNSGECVDCIRGKICRANHPSKNGITATESNAILHIDTCGPMKTTTFGGNKYFILATEEYSGYKLIEFAPEKSQIPGLVKKIITQVETETTKTVRAIQTDNGTEFKNRELDSWLTDKGILHEFSAPYCPEQNGRAERSNRTIIEGVRTLLLASGLTERLWAEAARTVVYATNRTASSNSKITHYEKYFGKKPDVGNMRVFGQYAIVKTPKSKMVDKYLPVGDFYRFVGYTKRSNTYRLYNEQDEQIIISCDAHFLNTPMESMQYEDNENHEAWILTSTSPNYEFPKTSQRVFLDAIAEETGDQNDFIRELTNDDLQLIQDDSPTSNINDQIHDEILRCKTSTPIQGASKRAVPSSMVPIFSSSSGTSKESTDASTKETGQETSVISSLQNSSQLMNQATDNNQQEINNEPTRRVTRSMTGSSRPRVIEDVVDINKVDIKSLYTDCPDTHEYEELLFTLDDEPRTLKDAKESPNWPEWRKAMDDELEALERNKTWTITDRPPNVKPIKNKWVFKAKLNPDGSLARYKARLVAKGYSQIPNVDYKETFAPVASMNTIRIMFAAANQLDMELIQFDVKTAFLHGDLEETIYMQLPEGFEVSNNKVCKLNKSLYGLKQAPRAWNTKFNHFLSSFNLRQSKVDKCLYYTDDRSMLLAIYVDDGIAAAKNKKLLDKLTSYLKEFLELTTMECNSYLGFQVRRDRKNRTIDLSQSHYVDKILDKYKMSNCNAISTPEEVGNPDLSLKPKLTPEYPFKEIIGALIYLTTCTRPDIAHAVNIASRTSEPTQAHWKLVKRILRYLKGTRNLGLRFRWEKFPELVGYSDADYANDVKTRRSTTGFCIIYGGGPVAWRCQRQSIVSLSTTEAEYISGCELVKEILPIREILIEIGQIEDKPARIFIDNQSAVNIAKNDGGTQRTKHIDVRKKWLNEQLTSRKITVEHVPGKDQAADILTKPLNKTKFQLNRAMLMSLVSMLLLILCAGLTEMMDLNPISPIHYQPTQYQYFTGNKEFDLTIVILNPCDSYFRNITPDSRINDRLINDCDTLFLKRTKQTMLCCGNTTCMADAKNGKYPSDQVVNNRIKRVAPALYVVGYIVLAGIQTYSTVRTELNTNNINQIATARNTEVELIEQGYKAFNVTRETIHGINDRLKDLEMRVDYIDSKLDAFPQIMALINEYDNSFSEIYDALVDIDQLAKYRKASSRILKLTKESLWTEPAAQWSTLNECTYKMQNKSFMLNQKFNMPVRDGSVKIFQSDSFRFWNFTNTGLYCWMKYVGPRLVLANTTNNCYLDIQEYWMKDGSLRGQPCDEENGILEHTTHLYHKDVCMKKFIPSRRYTQIKEVDGFHRIYCYGLEIEIRGKNQSCPDHVFELPLSESFGIGKHKFQSTRVTNTVINTLDLQINRDIARQLNSQQIRIYGSNLTNLNKEYSFLDEMIGKINKNITLKQLDLPEFLKSPFTQIVDTLNTFWRYLEKGLLIAAIIAGIFLLLLSAPLIELVILVIKILKRTVTKGLSRLLRRNRNRRSSTDYWDDSYSIRTD